MKTKKAFSLLETTLALGTIALLYLYFNPIQEKIGEQSKQALSSKVTTEMEIAKNKFDQGASQKEKDAFNNGSEDERFNKLAPHLKTSSSTEYFAGTPIKTFRINSIGRDVEILEIE